MKYHILLVIALISLAGTSVPIPFQNENINYNVQKQSSEFSKTIFDMDSGLALGPSESSRSVSLIDQDEFGGSWFCDLQYLDGVEWKENIAIKNSAVELSGGTIITHTAVDGLASSQIQGGKYPVDATFDKMWPTCDGTDPANGDFTRSGTHPRPAYSGNPNKLHWKPTDADWNDNEAWFYHDYGQQITFNALSNSITNDGRTNTYSVEVSNSDSGPWAEIISSGSRDYVTTFRFSEVTARYIRAVYTDVSIEVPCSEELEVWSYYDYSTTGSVVSEEIELPSTGSTWSVLSVSKNQPVNTQIKVSVIDASSNLTIPGFDNLTEPIIEISDISVSRIRLKAWLKGNGSVTPYLDSWGAEWITEDCWRDGFTGKGKNQESSNLNFSGKVDLIDLDKLGEMRSNAIEIPFNRTWASLNFNRTVPENTYLNISVHDADTDELLLRDDNRTDKDNLDLSGINASANPSIFIYGEFNSDGIETPTLYSWSINWTCNVPVEENDSILLIKNVPAILHVMEDIPQNAIIDFVDYFSIPCPDIHPPSYAIQHVTDIENITLRINGSKMDVVNLGENWTGTCSMIVNCTSAYDRCGSSSNIFDISVMAVDDAPVWKRKPQGLSVKRGRSSVSSFSLDDYIIDAENDNFGFNIDISGSGLTVELDDSNHINVTHKGDYSGNAIITVIVYQLSNDSLFSTVSIPIEVRKNIPPVATLISPRNGAIISSTELVLMWEAEDSDTAVKEVTFKLYFGIEESPGIYLSDLEKNYREIDNLIDGVTYYWSVIPLDEIDEGNCSNGPWSFTVDRSKLIPEISYLSPANGAIISVIDIDLTWQVHNESDEKLDFEIYFGDSRDILSKIGTTENKFFPLEALRENITYYWKVTPMGDGVLGRSKSGVWSFTIEKNFTTIHNISGSVDSDRITVEEGTTAISFNLTVNNTGNNANTVRIFAGGELSNIVFISPAQMSLLQGENYLVKVNVFVTDLEPGLYNFFLVLAHEGLLDEIINLSVIITPRVQNVSTETSEGEKKVTEDTRSQFYSILFAIIIGSIVFSAFIVIVFRRRKKIDEDRIADLNMEIDSLKTDIVHVPSRGHVKAIEMPHLRDVEEKCETEPVDGKDDKVKKSGKSKYDIRKRKDPGKIDLAPARTDSGKEYFDISGIFMPKEPSPDQTKGGVNDKVLALPPARFLEINEEERKVPIEELFLMTPTGILLQYFSLERETPINEDILASMLSAVTSFILDSLTMVGKEDVDEGDLCIDMGEFSVILATGETLNLVAITNRDKKDDVKGQLAKGVDVLEEKFGEIMTNWDGDMGKIEGVRVYVESLVKGEFDILVRKKQLASRQIPDSIQLTEGIDTISSKIGLLERGKDEKIEISGDANENDIEVSMEKSLFDMPHGASPIEEIIGERVDIVPEKSDPPPPPDQLEIEIWGGK